MEFRISINVTKSTLLVPFRKVVGHIVSKRKTTTNLDKVPAIACHFTNDLLLQRLRDFLTIVVIIVDLFLDVPY